MNFFLFLSVIFTNLVSAKKWTNNVGVGATVSALSIGCDEKDLDTDNVFQLGYGISGTYIGLHESGFTAKVDVAVGLATSKDVSIQQNNTINLGAFENIALGVGYSFINKPKILFGSALMVGVEMGQYSVESEDEDFEGVNYETLKTTLSLLTMSTGVDVFAVYRVSENFGLFANLAARYVIFGNSTYEQKYEKSETGKKSYTITDIFDLNGNYIIQPAIGVIWKF